MNEKMQDLFVPVKEAAKQAFEAQWESVIAQFAGDPELNRIANEAEARLAKNESIKTCRVQIKRRADTLRRQIVLDVSKRASVFSRWG